MFTRMVQRIAVTRLRRAKYRSRYDSGLWSSTLAFSMNVQRPGVLTTLLSLVHVTGSSLSQMVDPVPPL